MMDDANVFTDEDLTAYLDGELDAQKSAAIAAMLETDEGLASRLAALDLPIAQIREVMDPKVLGAPALPASLRAPAPAGRSTSRFVLPLTVAASFAIGVALTSFLRPAAAPETVGWLEAVASYQALYVTETLAKADQDAQSTETILTRAGETYGVALAPATQLDGLDFKRAQMLGFNGRPLLQMAYLTADGIPMALCVVQVDEADRGPENTVMFDLAGVSWVEDGVGYFLVGGDDASFLDRLTGDILAAI